MATAVSHPTIEFLSATHAIAASASTPGVEYHLHKVDGQWVCPCRGFQFRGTCRHTTSAAASALTDSSRTRRAAPFMCSTCGQSPAAANKTECWTCINHRRDDAAQMTVVEAVAIPALEPTCHCCRCGALYTFTESAPLYCPACQPVQAGHGWEQPMAHYAGLLAELAS